ncbi:MAG: cyclic nucleotide-binding domain-containing protein [Hyphomicrobiaceae bacterium]
MSIEDEVSVMRRIPLFAHITPQKLKLLAFTSERMAFEPGQMVFHQGEVGDAAYVIIEGQADVLVDSPKGAVSVATVERNALIGEVAILCDVPRTASIKAITLLDTLRITKAQFLELLTEYPELSIEIMKILAQRLAKTSIELSDARSRLRALGSPPP